MTPNELIAVLKTATPEQLAYIQKVLEWGVRTFWEETSGQAIPTRGKGTDAIATSDNEKGITIHVTGEVKVAGRDIEPGQTLVLKDRGTLVTVTRDFHGSLRTGKMGIPKSAIAPPDSTMIILGKDGGMQAVAPRAFTEPIGHAIRDIAKDEVVPWNPQTGELG